MVVITTTLYNAYRAGEISLSTYQAALLQNPDKNQPYTYNDSTDLTEAYDMDVRVISRDTNNRIPLTIEIDGGGSEIGDNVKGWCVVPVAGDIVQWTILADQSGSITLDVWKDVIANHPPTVADEIVGTGTKPAISTATYAWHAPAGWDTVRVAANDVIMVNVDSCTTITKVEVIFTIDPDTQYYRV